MLKRDVKLQLTNLGKTPADDLMQK